MRERRLMTLNLIGNRTLRPLTSLPLEYKDQSEEIDESKKAMILLENKLKNSVINHFYLDKGMIKKISLFIGDTSTKTTFLMNRLCLSYRWL